MPVVFITNGAQADKEKERSVCKEHACLSSSKTKQTRRLSYYKMKTRLLVTLVRRYNYLEFPEVLKSHLRGGSLTVRYIY